MMILAIQHGGGGARPKEKKRPTWA